MGNKMPGSRVVKSALNQADILQYLFSASA